MLGKLIPSKMTFYHNNFPVLVHLQRIKKETQNKKKKATFPKVCTYWELTVTHTIDFTQCKQQMDKVVIAISPE